MAALRITVPAPIVRRSVHTGTLREKITAPGPIFAPSARRYNVYTGVPMKKRAAGLDRISVLTTQKRTYARLHKRICSAFQRPMSSHFAATGTAETARKAELLATINRRQIPTAPEPAKTHREPTEMATTG